MQQANTGAAYPPKRACPGAVIDPTVLEWLNLNMTYQLNMLKMGLQLDPQGDWLLTVEFNTWQTQRPSDKRRNP